jgi:putative flippase GtrA
LTAVSEATNPSPQSHGPFASLRSALPAAEVIRFLIVGVWNTIFAYALFAGFVAFYVHLLPHKWIVFTADLASITTKPLGITMAFLCYKHFVFHTKGNYLAEWLRCFAVYGVGMIPELIALPLLTKLFLILPFKTIGILFSYVHVAHPAPYLAGIVVAVFTAMYSYFAHKKFSFRQ